ncbi:lipoprotein [Streptomyces viridochromogenes]|uniref:Lipoprotein n=1 Tax=Streptomyces viridochromogenes TaxID=1938 RepID=A0A0J7ZJM0_STRVR|nr:lipoprotein [Streptomyces viridochromogenes]
MHISRVGDEHVTNAPYRRARFATAALAALTALVLGGCDSGSDAKSAAEGGPSVIAPGKPGESNRMLSAEEAARQRAEDDSPNSADVAYARMMIEHHSQALRMTELAPDRAESTKVRKLAERIAAAQGPEITAMKGWLKNNGKAEKGDGHEHASMPGMATEAQLTELGNAHGRAFDQLFLTLMITHHNGAITMATDVKGQGNNIRIEEMADEVVAQQTSEITRMREML